MGACKVYTCHMTDQVKPRSTYPEEARRRCTSGAMLRRTCYMVSRVAAWRSLLVLLCVSHAAPWSVVGAAVLQGGGGGTPPQPQGGFNANSAGNSYTGNGNFNGNGMNKNGESFNEINTANRNNNNHNTNNKNTNLGYESFPKANNYNSNSNNLKVKAFPAGFNNGNVDTKNNYNNNNAPLKFLGAPNPARGAGVNPDGERLWPALPLENQKNVAAPAAYAWPAKALGSLIDVRSAGGVGLGAVPAPERGGSKARRPAVPPAVGGGANPGLAPPPPLAKVKPLEVDVAAKDDVPVVQKGFGLPGVKAKKRRRTKKHKHMVENHGLQKANHDDGGHYPGTPAPGKPFPPTVAYTLFNASYVKNDEGSNRKYPADGGYDNNKAGTPHAANDHLTWRRRRKIRKPGVTAPPSKPNMDMKKHVSWFEGSRMYAFRASPDTRLLIRHAPIPSAGSPWPLPQHYYPEDIVFTLRPENFQFHAIGEICDILDFQFDRIRRNTFGDEWEKAEEDGKAGGNAGGSWGDQQQGDRKYKEIRYANVTILKECPKFPSLNDDESYDLEIKRSGASIIAREVWGAVRALETFSQLIYQDEDGRYLLNRTLINDFPRFPHRGILLDTARHYLNKETLINNLEAMAQNKMNVFHWHITDDQSFPFESKTFPNLTKNGAYNSRTHTYTHEAIAEIVEEARLRGIRVIPEFDTPGHTFSWGFGQDYLLTPCYDYSRQPNGLFGPINPILKSTYLFLQRFFREVLAVFKDKYIHLGGDEVPFDCWESNPQINNFIKRNNLTDIRDVLGLYERKLLEIVTQLGKGRDKGSGYIVWQEVVDNGVNVKADTIVQVWMGDAFDVERMINMGLRVIYSTCWYLDYINYGQDWDKYYRCEQLDQLQNFQLKNSSLLLGGEAALWTEYADDENIISRLWPRASAAAERLWSNKNVRDEVAAASRIEEQRCRMLRRGLKVGVLSGPGHCPVWSRKGRPQRSHDTPVFSWSSHNDEMQFKSNYPQVYVVDMNAMYLVPVLIVICICCLTLITLAQDSKSKIVAILSYPVAGSSKKGVRGLLYVFMAFAFAWCIWTAPIWMNSWETSANKARPVAPQAVNGEY